MTEIIFKKGISKVAQSLRCTENENGKQYLITQKLKKNHDP